MRFEIKARNHEHDTTNDKQKKCHERTSKSSQTFLATKLLVTNENNYLMLQWKIQHANEDVIYDPPLIFFACGVIVVKPTKTILILASVKL